MTTFILPSTGTQIAPMVGDLIEKKSDPTMVLQLIDRKDLNTYVAISFKHRIPFITTLSKQTLETDYKQSTATIVITPKALEITGK